MKQPIYVLKLQKKEAQNKGYFKQWTLPLYFYIFVDKLLSKSRMF